MKFLTIDLRSIIKFMITGIIWGVFSVSIQLRNHPSWQEYYRDGNPYLFFLAGFFGYFLTSIYIHHSDSKKAKEQTPKPTQ